MTDLDTYGDLRRCNGTDIMYRVRDDGEFILLFDADGDEQLAGLSTIDINTLLNDPDTDLETR